MYAAFISTFLTNISIITVRDFYICRLGDDIRACAKFWRMLSLGTTIKNVTGAHAIGLRGWLEYHRPHLIWIMPAEGRCKQRC